MRVVTHYGLRPWWGAIKWWAVRRRWRLLARTLISLPKAIYYEAHGGTIRTTGPGDVTDAR